ncbi:13956_t:CDS:2 [Entrophospora sp. SA101]|nr:13956_t:CDS:2 [Entrophospora sp. SA101]
MISTRYSVLKAYKNLLKVQKITFNGDNYALKEAKRKTWEEFRKNKDEVDIIKINKCIGEAEEVAGILKKNIVQAVLVDNDQKLFKLNITKDTELGDNESIKNPLSAKDLKEQLV